MGHQQALSEVAVEQSIDKGTLNYRAQFSYATTTGLLSDSWRIPFDHGITGPYDTFLNFNPMQDS